MSTEDDECGFSRGQDAALYTHKLICTPSHSEYTESAFITIGTTRADCGSLVHCTRLGALHDAHHERVLDNGTC